MDGLHRMDVHILTCPYFLKVMTLTVKWDKCVLENKKHSGSCLERLGHREGSKGPLLVRFWDSSF